MAQKDTQSLFTRKSENIFEPKLQIFSLDESFQLCWAYVIQCPSVSLSVIKSVHKQSTYYMTLYNYGYKFSLSP